MAEVVRETDQWHFPFAEYQPSHHRRELAIMYENTRLAMLIPHRKPAASPTPNKVFGSTWWSFCGPCSPVKSLQPAQVSTSS
ncbi:hypothetical protein M407DRAFT_242416 [Tulasnella calospora MUT 4182]|uniref:Uncharacterized protein n=1 Tax=Tulasnella calospora MUT 4182 TaxID=1051891 RepID=A0A0C3QQN0_9AGAM|nr:hypothetical protein M407DRAFT_242416 [Tulasnella calospora MUT 4182]